MFRFHDKRVAKILDAYPALQNGELMLLFLGFDYTETVENWLQTALHTAAEDAPPLLYAGETRLWVGDEVRIFPYGDMACEDRVYDPQCWDPAAIPCCRLPRQAFVDLCNAYGVLSAGDDAPGS